MKLWHPTDEASLDKLMDAEIHLYALSFCVMHFWCAFDSAVYCIYLDWI